MISLVVEAAARLSQQRQGRGGRHPWSPKESVWVTFQQTDLLLFAQLTDPVKVLKWSDLRSINLFEVESRIAWISFTMNGSILRKNPRTAHFVESAIEKRRGFPKFHNLQLPPELGWVDMKIGLFSKIGFVKSQTAPHRPSWRPRHGQVFFFTISRPQTLQLAQIASD